VISVGPNPYGHPAPDILATLEATGTEVRTTLTHGDIVIALCTTTCPN
jgi:beta-lactamase superfamily II metal-dependent hydrolase